MDDKHAISHNLWGCVEISLAGWTECSSGGWREIISNGDMCHDVIIWNYIYIFAEEKKGGW